MNQKVELSSDLILYRRQYIIGDRFAEQFPSWSKVQISDELFATIHPELTYTKVTTPKFSLHLLGFVLHPLRPEDSDEQILQDLADSATSFGDLVRKTFILGGKWALIYIDAEGTRAWNDPVGARQIYYHHTDQGTTWLASQPHMIAEMLDLPTTQDPEKLDFISFRKPPHIESGWVHEFGWIHDCTSYDDVHHLMPNKYLHLQNRKLVRYFPVTPTKEISSPEGIAKIETQLIALLKGTMQSATHRFKLSVAVTAGRDSRVVLAACKGLNPMPHLFQMKFKNMTDDHVDVAIPQQISKVIGHKIHAVPCFEIDEAFDARLTHNVRIVQAEYKKMLFFKFFKDFQGYTNVSGNMGEVLRGFYFQFVKKGTVLDKQYLAKLYNTPLPFAERQIELWLSDAEPVARDFSVDLLDLYYWEQRMANWGTSWQAALEIAAEEICPFNNREMIELSWQLPHDYRTKRLFSSMVRQMWGEIAPFPYNPQTTKQRFRKFCGRVLKSVGLFNIARKILRIR